MKSCQEDFHSFMDSLRGVCAAVLCSSTWHDGLHARVALGRVLVAVALHAHQRVVLGGERPVHQRAAALEAQEAFAVPVALFKGQILQSHRSSVQPSAQDDQTRPPLGFTLLVQLMSSWQTSHLLEKCSS